MSQLTFLLLFSLLVVFVDSRRFSPLNIFAPIDQTPPSLKSFPLEEYQYHGTTTLSFICKDGIIIAVDSRASMGDYVGSSTTRKLIPISDSVVATMAGGAADCSFW